MKQLFFNLRHITAGISILAFLSFAATPAYAIEKNTSVDVATLQPRVSYVGSDKHSSLFLVEMNNNKPMYFTIVIRDKDGSEIFSERYESAKFQQYFKLVNEGNKDGIDVLFSIESGEESVAFQATSPSPLTKNVSVNKL